MPWFFAVVEAEHPIQNPTSPEKIRLLGERMRLGPRSSVLDVGSGRGGPAVLLAQAFGCRITCLERAEEFALAARRRAREARVDALIEVVNADARDLRLQPERYDAAMCLGASFIWDGLVGPWPRSRQRCVAAGSSRSASPTGAGGRCRRRSPLACATRG